MNALGTYFSECQERGEKVLLLVKGTEQPTLIHGKLEAYDLKQNTATILSETRIPVHCEDIIGFPQADL